MEKELKLVNYTDLPHRVKSGSNITGKRAFEIGVVLSVIALCLLPATSVWAQQESTQLISTQKLGTEIIETLVYSIIGILMAVFGFKVVDWLTPGSLAEEVTHKENRALAILAGSMMLGVCIIIASVLVS